MYSIVRYTSFNSLITIRDNKDPLIISWFILISSKCVCNMSLCFILISLISVFILLIILSIALCHSTPCRLISDVSFLYPPSMLAICFSKSSEIYSCSGETKSINCFISYMPMSLPKIYALCIVQMPYKKNKLKYRNLCIEILQFL